MKIAIFVLADIFVPLMLRMGGELRSQYGHEVAYLNFLPRDHQLLSVNTEHLYPRNLSSLDGTAQLGYTVFNEPEVAEMVGFMQAKHGGTLAEWRVRVNDIARYLKHFIQTWSPDAFVVWNGQDHVGRVIARLARKFSIPVVYMENGYFSQTLQMDLHGVNAASSLSALSYAEIVSRASSEEHDHAVGEGAELPAFKLRSLSRLSAIWVAMQHHLNPRYYSRYPEQRGSSWLRQWWLNRYRQGIAEDLVALPAGFAFLAFQVHDDTQVLLNSKVVNSVEQFFDLCHGAIRKVCGPNFPIVVKEHPEDLGRRHYTDLKQRYPDVIWLRKFNIDTLLDQASLVCVVNSSVGLQAIERKKPTVLLGDAFYAKPEVAFVVSRADEVDAAISHAARGMDAHMAERMDRFVMAMRQTAFVKGGWRPAHFMHGGVNAANKLLEILGEAGNVK